MSQLTQYILALSNLYGFVHKSKIVEVYNLQNDDQITIEDVESYLSHPPKELSDGFIYPYKDYFGHESALEDNTFDLLLKKKGDKPHYVPKKSELLKYCDEGYFERNKQYKALLSYLKKNFFSGNKDNAEVLCEDIHSFHNSGYNMNAIMDLFRYYGISFKDIHEANEVMKLVTDLSNNMRIWENNGHTPHEIFEKYEKPNMKPLPDKPFDFNADMNTRQKIGRNDPCPCGSGKKYKKCCLGTGEN